MKVTLSNGKFCAFLMIRIRILLRKTRNRIARKNIARKEALQKQSMVTKMEKVRHLETEHPVRLHWEVTNRCNHNCVHCYNYYRSSEEIEKYNTVYTAEHYEKLAHVICDSIKPISVVLTGGEPLLVLECLKSTIAILQKEGIELSINTNASLVTDEIACYLAERGIGTFVSFPSDDEATFEEITSTTGSYNRVLTGIGTLRVHGVRTSLNMVVSKRNISQIFQTAKYVKDRYSVKQFTISRVSPPINAKQMFNKYMLTREDFTHILSECVHVKNELGLQVNPSAPYPTCSLTSQELFDMFAHKKSCAAAFTSCAMSPDGDIRACPRDDEIFGNVLETDFSQIWHSMDKWRDGSQIPAECSGCNDRVSCFGGCRVESYPCTGRKDSLDYVADPNNTPIRFSGKLPELPDWKGEQHFSLAENVRFLSERVGVRASCGIRGHLMLTLKLHSYLEEHGEDFSLDSFVESFECKRDDALRALLLLQSKGIIIEQNK